MVAGSSNGGRCSCMLLLLVSPLSPNKRQSNNNGNHSDDEWMIPGAPIKLPRPPHESNMQTTLWRCTTGTPGNNTHTNTNAKAHTHTYKQSHSRTHKHKRTHRHTHTHRDTNTHTGRHARTASRQQQLGRVRFCYGFLRSGDAKAHASVAVCGID